MCAFSRRIRSDDPSWSQRNAFRASIFERFIEPCNKSWRKRLQAFLHLPGGDMLETQRWQNRGQQVLREVEECRRVLKEHHLKKCFAPFYCYREIRSLPADELIWANQSWIVL
ncbi:unnamed protein product [Gongylonema pulchrum]|uniref:Transposase n=1 Tax=Gongylonema pulchrum TaxID=637853 RepID=A0A183EP46_9BILA|nr:unnamed protein product [Gongylonema pulchrum]